MSIVHAPDFDGIHLDTTTIPQKRLNIESKNRSNLFPWNGQFSPQLVEAFLQTYARPGAFILDPFLGSGTVLSEAGRLGHPAFGSEVNPAAFKMAEVYRFLNVKPASRRPVVEAVDDILRGLLPEPATLFHAPMPTLATPIQQSLAEAVQATDDPLQKSLLESLVVLLNYGDKALTAAAVLKAWRNLRDIVLALPYSQAFIDLANCDARALPLPADQADIVITSPPYVNVFNYHQQYRKSVETLGWNLLEVARSEIGSNRKNRGNRFLTVTQYCIDMTSVLAEIRRVCKPTARLIIVVGRESNVRKTRFFNGEIVARLATQSARFRLDVRQERVFQNRFGEWIYEDILHLIPCPANGSITTPHAIAKDVLEAARSRAPEESIPDLTIAIERIESAQASPTYNPEAAISCTTSRKVKDAV